MVAGCEQAGVPAPTRARWRQTKSLVMWSGGLDSTYALARLLETTDDEVHAHHVHCRTGDGPRAASSRRADYQGYAVAALRPALEARYRSFAFSESAVDLGDFTRNVVETTMAAYCAAHVAMSQGFTPFDRIVLGVNCDDDRGWQPETHAYALRRTVTLRVLRAVWESEEVPFLYVFNPRPSKQEEADALAPDLYAATASCREPELVVTTLGESRFRPCGVCPQCVVRARVSVRHAGSGAGSATAVRDLTAN